MTEISQIYKCTVCGNIIEVVHTGGGELVCCGQPMVIEQEKDMEEGTEKHRPIIERTDSGVIIRVGSVPHPMESEHYIEWIEVITEHRVYRKALEPNMEPLAEFCLNAVHISARAYCNKHGLWKS